MLPSEPPGDRLTTRIAAAVPTGAEFARQIVDALTCANWQTFRNRYFSVGDCPGRCRSAHVDGWRCARTEGHDGDCAAINDHGDIIRFPCRLPVFLIGGLL